MGLSETVTIPLEEYKELIETKTKAEQYRNFLIDNANNNVMTKGLTVIEGKNLYKLIKEREEK